MKKILALLSITAVFFMLSCSNEKKEDKAKTEDPGKIETTMKETPVAQLVAHACTDQCKDGGHTYKHGEEGHTCSEACLKSGAVSHSCTEKCKDGSHFLAHGEEGHVCGEECGKM